MIEESQFLSEPRQLSPILSKTTPNKKVNVYFTYQSSPQPVFQENLKVIKEQEEEKRRKKIFEPRRKFSYQEESQTKRRSSKIRIFEEKTKRNSTMNSPFLLKKKDSNMFGNYSSGIFTTDNDYIDEKVLKRNSTQMVLKDSLNTAFYEKSPIYLRDSVISGVETIVDQLEDLEPELLEKNPIQKKLSSIKNRQTKRTFYSNTVKNSLMMTNENKNEIKRNRIDSEVLTYQYSPNLKYRSSVTIKATNRLYGMSKFSNNLSVLTNENNNKLLEDFQDKEDVETPKYHKSAYRSVLRKSYEPSVNVKNDRENSKESQRKNNLLEINNHPQSDRFYDESSIETPRLPVVSKKISYEVIDPLTSSLKKQKMERKQLRKISEDTEVKKPNENKFKVFFVLILSLITQLVSKTTNNAQKGKESCFRFLRSELFFLIIIVMLSLTIFAIQLVQ